MANYENRLLYVKILLEQYWQKGFNVNLQWANDENNFNQPRCYGNSTHPNRDSGKNGCQSINSLKVMVKQAQALENCVRPPQQNLKLFFCRTAKKLLVKACSKPLLWNAKLIMTTQTTTCRTLYVHVVLNDAIFSQIL